jgi:hypothetical protein
VGTLVVTATNHRATRSDCSITQSLLPRPVPRPARTLSQPDQNWPDHGSLRAPCKLDGQ